MKRYFSYMNSDYDDWVECFIFCVGEKVTSPKWRGGLFCKLPSRKELRVECHKLPGSMQWNDSRPPSLRFLAYINESWSSTPWCLLSSLHTMASTVDISISPLAFLHHLCSEYCFKCGMHAYFRRKFCNQSDSRPAEGKQRLSDLKRPRIRKQWKPKQSSKAEHARKMRLSMQWYIRNKFGWEN